MLWEPTQDALRGKVLSSQRAPPSHLFPNPALKSLPPALRGSASVTTVAYSGTLKSASRFRQRAMTKGRSISSLGAVKDGSYFHAHHVVGYAEDRRRRALTWRAV